MFPRGVRMKWLASVVAADSNTLPSGLIPGHRKFSSAQAISAPRRRLCGVDTRQLKYFLAVVDHDGFNRAAEHLLIAQPSLSQTIAGLEKELGVPLFHRIGRRAVLSEAGKELVGPARLVMRDLDAAQSAVQALRGVRSGRLDIITMPSPGIEPLTSMIAEFIHAHPSVRLNVGAAFTPEEV